MSAGVAVAFKEQFGKPRAFHLLTSHLALQKSQNRASVYSLITKATYWGKPFLNDYNLAFGDLTKDFKNRQLKHLICSPTGCVGD